LFGCGEKCGGDIRPVAYHFAQSVDGRGAHVRAGVVLEEVERSWHPKVLTGTALVLFAAIARQGVKGPSADPGILVIEGDD
jgi:hypothetical protein